MKKTLPYYEPVVRSTQAKDSPEMYFASEDLFDDGQLVEAIRMVLDSNNPDISAKYGNSDGTRYRIPHGSVVITIDITPAGMVEVEIPFMRVPEKNAVAMLRAVAKLNTGKLMLARFYLAGNQLVIRWSCPLEQAHPMTVDWQVTNMCRVADEFDDEFAANFGAERICEPEVRRYDDATLDYLYDAVQSIGRMTLDAVAEFTKERRFGIAWNALMSAFCQIDYVAHPQGKFAKELTDAIYALNDDEHTPESLLVKKAVVAMEKILSKSRDEVAADLYEIHVIESPKRRSTVANLQKNFKNIYRDLLDRYQGGDYSQVAVGFIRKIYEAYHYCDMDDSINEMLSEALREAADKPFEEAGKPLIACIERLMNMRSESDENGDDDDEGPCASEIDDGGIADGDGAGSDECRYESLRDELLDLQNKLTEALVNRNLAEYALYATRIQQRIMTELLS